MVEHPLGKGEVHSSILCGSTRNPKGKQGLALRALPCPPRLDPERGTNTETHLGENWGTAFPRRSNPGAEPTDKKSRWRRPPDPEKRNAGLSGNSAGAAQVAKETSSQHLKSTRKSRAEASAKTTFFDARWQAERAVFVPTPSLLGGAP